MSERFYAEPYGENWDNWAVCEEPGGGRELPIYLMSWLSEGQAKAIAEALNDIAGYEWHTRHPEWFGRVTE